MNIAASNDVRDVASTKTPERNGNQKLQDYELSIERNSVFDLLKQLAIDNEVYFKQCYPSVYTTRIAECCQEIYISLDLIRDTVEKFLEAAKSRDYDANTPGNGFRSLVCIIDVVTLRLVSVLRSCQETRTSLLFRTINYCKEIESYAAILRFSTLAFNQVIAMLSMLDDDSLFPPLNSDYEQFNGILKGIESLDASCFYGRHLGFQFSQSVKRIFNVIGMVLAGYSMSWTIGCGSVGILMNSAKLLLNPEERASRIMKVIREADIEFCRGFWNLSELPDAKLFCPSLAVCEKSEIPLVGAIAIDSNGQDFIYISPPKAHGIPEPIPIKILDVVMRKAEQKPNLPIKAQLSPNLVIHCHGGGYVATSSKSHETYLRGWAKSLECPLISIDYSLAPESPFPRAMEEVLYAYAYILNHPTDFGWSGEKVCMVGDSAGGNLIISMNLRLIELGAKRLPDGIVPIYTPFLFQYLPSSSRVLSFMDPLLHMGVVIRCAKAYTVSEYADAENNVDKESSFRDPSANFIKHPTLSEYVNQLDKTNLLNSEQLSESIISLMARSQFPNKLDSTQSIIDNVAKEQVDSSPMKRVHSDTDLSSFMSCNQGIGDSDDDVDETFQTVEVSSDDSNIHLTSTNVDQDLIDYLQIHPTTTRYIQFAEESFADSTQSQDVDIHKNEDKMAKFENVKASVSSFQASLSVSSMNDSCKSDHLPVDSRLTASAGRVPMKRRKKPLRPKGRSLSQSFMGTASMAAGRVYDNISDWFSVQKTPIGHKDKSKLLTANRLTPHEAAAVQLKEAEKHESRFTELLKLKLPRNYLMSPLYAPPEILRQLPPVYFVACHLDPLLDDTIMFAKRVRDSGGQVRSVDLLDSLPHGFLNFTPMSTNCRNGADLCLQRIKQSLQWSD